MSLLLRQMAKCGHDVMLSDRSEKFANQKTKEIFTALPQSTTFPDVVAPNNDRAVVKTLRGVKVFDNTNTENIATHKLTLFYRGDVGAEQWVTLKGKNLRILTAENCCEKENTLILMCTERGLDSKVVNHA